MLLYEDFINDGYDWKYGAKTLRKSAINIATGAGAVVGAVAGYTGFKAIQHKNRLKRMKKLKDKLKTSSPEDKIKINKEIKELNIKLKNSPFKS